MHIKMSENPYNVLGIPQGAAFTEVRAAYIRLAKAHHPDKLQHAVDIEAHEEEFKRVTMAYKKIESREKHGGTADWAPGIDDLGGGQDWATIFKKIFRQAVSEINKRYHLIEVPVKLEEIHNKKIKKLEVFLRDMNDAVYVKVNCGKWPETTIMHEGHIIKIRFSLKHHDVYHLDDILGTHDLYTTCHLTWAEYLTGTASNILWCDGKTRMLIDIPPLCDADLPIILKNRGLWGDGNLYIKIHIKHPSVMVWDSMPVSDKKTLIELLATLSR